MDPAEILTARNVDAAGISRLLDVRAYPDPQLAPVILPTIDVRETLLEQKNKTAVFDTGIVAVGAGTEQLRLVIAPKAGHNVLVQRMSMYAVDPSGGGLDTDGAKTWLAALLASYGVVRYVVGPGPKRTEADLDTSATNQDPEPEGTGDDHAFPVLHTWSNNATIQVITPNVLLRTQRGDGDAVNEAGNGSKIHVAMSRDVAINDPVRFVVAVEYRHAPRGVRP